MELLGAPHLPQPKEQVGTALMPLCYPLAPPTQTHTGPRLLEGHCTCPRQHPALQERMSWAVRVGLQECLNFIEKWYLVLTMWYFNCLMLTCSCNIGLLGLSKDFGYVTLLPWQEGNLRKKKKQECWIWVNSDAWPPWNMRLLSPLSLLPP